MLSDVTVARCILVGSWFVGVFLLAGCPGKESTPPPEAATSKEPAPSASIVTSTGTPASTPTSPAGKGASCVADADCKVISSYCVACACLALPAGEPAPPCQGPSVQCLLDPCQKKVARCVAGACTAGDAP